MSNIFPVAQLARDGGLALALASDPERRRQLTEHARLESIESRARKAGRPGMAARIAEAEAELPSITCPVERERKQGWIAEAKQRLARLEELRRQHRDQRAAAS